MKTLKLQSLKNYKSVNSETLFLSIGGVASKDHDDSSSFDNSTSYDDSTSNDNSDSTDTSDSLDNVL